ncbi:membrane protein insertase YidC [Cellulomonas cellasea]|uniref:membrane protein insertase YidC n=1 Tax=Cellulomonas cellasea TaxID=43670 RepID=UPI0025A45A43|nr:membrane protein insertase YidC [Cellulomonas cellasea]MDM8085181.1 membrane protein insertase YidC [Cellulomonas cellasea]
MSWFDGLLWPIMVVVAWIMVQFHKALAWLGMDPAGGIAWTLSIVGLVVVIRIILIPLFFKQIRASRGMQLLAPEMQAIQKKYKGKQDPASREAMSRETMALYKKHGTNPFASCLPILLQSPIFFALFRVLYSMPLIAAGTYERSPNIGPITPAVAQEFESATIFGAPLSGYFLQPGADINIKIVTVILIVAMSATTFFTQRQLTMKNMPPAALQGPMAQQQKMMLYALPVIFAISGVNFPIGVLVYWTTTNVWSMGQQFYTIRRMPAPGSAAEKALKERKARKAAAKGIVIEEEKPVIEEKPRGQRPQPKRKDRAKPRPVDGSAAPAETPSADAEPSGEAQAPKRPAGQGPKPSGTSAARKPASGSKPTTARPKPSPKKKPTK